MAYEAQDPYLMQRSPLLYARRPPFRTPVHTTRLEAGSWLGLAVAAVVILAGAVAVFLGPRALPLQVVHPEPMTPQVVEVLPGDGGAPQATTVPPLR